MCLPIPRPSIRTVALPTTLAYKDIPNKHEVYQPQQNNRHANWVVTCVVILEREKSERERIETTKNWLSSLTGWHFLRTRTHTHTHKQSILHCANSTYNERDRGRKKRQSHPNETTRNEPQLQAWIVLSVAFCKYTFRIASPPTKLGKSQSSKGTNPLSDRGAPLCGERGRRCCCLRGSGFTKHKTFWDYPHLHKYSLVRSSSGDEEHFGSWTPKRRIVNENEELRTQQCRVRERERD